MKLQYKIKSSELPLLFQHTINSQTQLAVWKIEEPIIFFQEKLSLSVPGTHPQKQLQFLTGRYLLKQMHPNFPLHEIKIEQGMKPFLANNSLMFSITHTDQFVAAIVSQQNAVGIDMEIISGKAIKVASRFLHPEEMVLLASHDVDTLNKIATLLWSVKESVYKWRGEKGVDFSEQIHIKTIHNKEQIVEGVFIGSSEISFQAFFREIEGSILSWVG